MRETTPTIGEGDRSYVTALSRGLSVMKAFTGSGDRLSLSDLSELVDLPRATVRRCLLTLEALGYVERSGRFFSLTPEVLVLAQAYLSSSPMPRIAQAFLERLSQRLGVSSSLSVLHGEDVIYIARSTRKRLGSLHRDVGSRLPAYCTSMGRVLLAALSPGELDAFLAASKFEPRTPNTITNKSELRQALDKIRHTGYSVVDQELEIDLRGIAVPVRNAAGSVVAALNISAQASKMKKREMIDAYLPPLLEAAGDMRPLLVS